MKENALKDRSTTNKYKQRRFMQDLTLSGKVEFLATTCVYRGLYTERDEK